jgi:chromosomal replication initiator protein
LHSIGNSLRENNKKAVVLYQTTDRFVNEFINAIRFNKVYNFNEKYKKVDALLIDDVQFISNKEQTQEAFFHIFNVLYESRKQIVLSSDTVPQHIEGLAERLQSRLGGGLVADIHAPTLETKIAIIKKKAELSNSSLLDEVAQFIAKTTVSNIRELEGALIRVMAFASLMHQEVTLELAKKVLLNTDAPEKDLVDFSDVIKGMQQFYPCTLEQLCSKSRNQQLSFIRQVAMFLFKTVANKSLREIGEYLGGRDHSTVMHAVNKIKQYADNQEDFYQILKKIEHESFR